jgi:pyruvate ferredoxin oxidoreductase beta subunit
MVKIMEAHGLCYIATATSSYPADLYDKVKKARFKTGTRYIHITAPCPPGWVFPTKDTIKMGRLAVDTGAAVLFEIEDGEFHLTGKSKSIAHRGALQPIDSYIDAQRRFKGISDEDRKAMQDWVTRRWNEYVRRDDASA